MGTELAPHAEVEAVVAALHARDLGFLTCIAGLMAIKDVPLTEAKWLVHAIAALRHGRLDREAAWAAMYEEEANRPE